MYNPSMWEEEREDAVEGGEEEDPEAEVEEVAPPEVKNAKGKERTKTEAEKDPDSGKRQLTWVEIGWGLCRGYKWAERAMEELKEKKNARGVQRPVTCPKN